MRFALYGQLADEFGTPLWVIDEEKTRTNYKKLKKALRANYEKIKLYYAMKANSSLSVLRILRKEGACVDTASPGEVLLALRAGFSPSQLMFTAPNVRNEELRFLLDRGIKINVDSLSELRRLLKIGIPDFISVRVNPGVGAGCHPYDVLGGKGSKFGLSKEKALEAYEVAKHSGITRYGLHMHIGSGILSVKPFLKAGRKLLELAKEAHQGGIEFEQIDFGGGIGIPYKPEENEIDIEDFSAEFLGLFKQKIEEYGLGSPTFAMEPGRCIVGNAAVLLTRVNTIKNTSSKKFVGVDAGFNTLIRPALYRAYHDIVLEKSAEPSERCDVVGPLCEASDFLALDRNLPKVEEGDLLVVKNAGAYGFSMSSPYISRPRAAEVLVKGDRYELIREREGVADLLRHQRIASWLE